MLRSIDPATGKELATFPEADEAAVEAAIAKAYAVRHGWRDASEVASLLLLPKLDQRTVMEWLHAPSGAVPMALFIIVGFRHALDGMKVFVDDYLHEPGRNFAVNTLLLFLAVGGGALALFELARIAFASVN